MGGVPVALHHNLYPGNATTSEAGNSTFGEAVEITSHYAFHESFIYRHL